MLEILLLINGLTFVYLLITKKIDSDIEKKGSFKQLGFLIFIFSVVILSILKFFGFHELLNIIIFAIASIVFIAQIVLILKKEA